MPAVRRRHALLKGLVLSLASTLAPLAPVARADEPKAAHAGDTQRAKDLFQQGTTLFNIGEFDKAIEAWQEGYKAKADPGFLYNIGQAYRLKGDPTKAIFFYRGYLRNSPKAPNRADIEAKIEALQQQKEATEAKPAAPPPVAPPPVAPAPASVPAPAPVAPPPAPAPPLAGPATSAPEAPAPFSELPPSPPPAFENAPWDISAGLGLDVWRSGLDIKGNAPAQLGLELAGGYTFGEDVYRAASFRVGGLLTVSSVDEGSGSSKNTLSFTSLLVEPSARLRLVDHRLYLTGGLGLGVLAIGGVKTTSVVLAPNQNIKGVSGTLSTFEVRPAVGLQLHLTPRLLAFVSPALSFGVKPQYFYQTLGRFELMFGLSYLL